MKKLCLLTAFFLTQSTSLEAALFAATPDHSNWKNTMSPLSCVLSHTIPLFGQGSLIHLAGEPPIFQLESLKSRDFPEDSVAQVYSIPGAWSRAANRDHLAEVPVTPGRRVIALERPILNHALSALQAGRQLGIALPKEDKGELEAARVQLSSIGFLKAYHAYERCLEQLVPVSFKQLAKTDLSFETNTMRLSQYSEKMLEYMLIYDEQAGPLRKIVLEGHADNVGRFANNTKLSLQRALAVKDWFVFAGIPPEMIEVKSLGASRPIASNKTPEGRALNRRVTVSLIR